MEVGFEGCLDMLMLCACCLFTCTLKHTHTGARARTHTIHSQFCKSIKHPTTTTTTHTHNTFIFFQSITTTGETVFLWKLSVMLSINATDDDVTFWSHTVSPFPARIILTCYKIYISWIWHDICHRNGKTITFVSLANQ